MTKPELSWVALERLHDYYADTAIGICNQGEEVTHQLMIVDTDEEGTPTHMAATPPEMMKGFFDQNAGGKNAFASFIRALLTPGAPLREQFEKAVGFSPRALVFICEAWALAPKSTKETDDLVSGRRRVSDSPDRKEVLQVMVHTPELTVMTMHEIKTKPTRHCVRGKFPTREEAEATGGRFAMQDRNRDLH